MDHIAFNKVIIKNFKSFMGTHVFEFYEQSGFFILSGENKVDQKLGSNGAGKSSVFDALYGVSIDGKKGPDLLNKNLDPKTSTYSVAVEMVKNNIDNVAINRVWNPNKILLFDIKTKEKKDITNQYIEDYIHLNPNQFLNSVLMGQGSPLFFDLSSSEKSELFHNILDLDIWVELSDKAKSLENNISMEKNSILMDISKCEGALGSLSDKEKIHNNIEEWEKTRKVIIDEKEAEIKDVEARIEILTTELQKYIIDEEAIEANREALDRCLADIKELSGAIHKKEMGISSVDGDIDRYTREVDFYDSHTTCPTCLQEITKDFIKNKVSDIKNEITTKKDANKNNTTFLNELRKKLPILDKEETKLRDQHQSINIGRDKKSQIETHKNRKQHLMGRIEYTKNDKNPFIVMLDQIDAQRKKYQSDIESLHHKINVLEQEQEMYRFWKDSFKKIRLFIISSIVKQLSLDINTAMELTGLDGWKVDISTEFLTKGGELRQAFSVDISSPYIGSKLPWELWSGGEAQRLRIASAMGLSTLIQRLKGVSFNVEIWDEPTTFLSEHGIQDLLNLLKNRSSILKTQIWLISHTIDSYGSFTGETRVTKDINGSHVERIEIEGE